MDDDEFRATAKAYARKHYAGQTVSVTSDGAQIEIPWSGIKHAFNHGMSRNEAAVALKLGELLQSSKLEFSEPDRYGRNTILAVHNYKTSAVIDNKKTEVVLQVREQHDGKRYYDHYEIKRPAGQSGKLTKGEAHSSRITGRLILEDFSISPTLAEVKPTPQRDAAPMLLKSHIRQYTKQNGTVVQEHEDSRFNPNRLPITRKPKGQYAGAKPQDTGYRIVRDDEPESGTKGRFIIYDRDMKIVEIPNEAGEIEAHWPKLLDASRALNRHKGTEHKLDKHAKGEYNAIIQKAHVASYQRTTASGAVAYVREHEDSRVRKYGRLLHFAHSHADLHAARQARFGHLPNWGQVS